MNGDFDDDDFSDISVGDKKGRNRRKSDRRSKKQKASHVRNPDELSDSEDENDDADDHLEARFTADGMRYFDKDGNVVEKEEGRDQNDADSDSNGGDDSEEDEDEDEDKPLVKGTRVQGCYRIEEQYNGQGDWYDGVIVNIKKQSDGTYKYDVEYDDGDFEENMIRKNIRVEKQSVKDDNDDDDDSQSLGKKKKKKGSDMDSKELQVKQKLAKEKARCVTMGALSMCEFVISTWWYFVCESELLWCRSKNVALVLFYIPYLRLAGTIVSVLLSRLWLLTLNCTQMKKYAS
jgi:hypothetical protein